LKICIFEGYVINTLPKLGYALGDIHLWAKFGPLSALQSALRRGRRIFVFGG